MIYVITVLEEDERTGRIKRVVSHGVDSITGRNVVLPCETPQYIGAVFDEESGEYVLYE